MQPISDLLSRIVDVKSSQSLYPILLRDWDKIFGKLKNKIRLEEIKRGTIVLCAYDSTWLHELNMLSEVLLQKINSHLPEPNIKKIKLKLCAKKACKIEEKKPDKKNIQVNLRPHELKALKKIDDPELAIQLKQYLKR